MWVIFSGLAVTAIVLTGAYFALRAAATARTPQGAVGWVLFLLGAPIIAVPIYLFLGHHRYRGYNIARRQSQVVVEAIRAHAMANAPDPKSVTIPPKSFEYCAGLPAVRGNSADLLIDGAAAFEAMFAAIDAAEDYVLIQFYIVRDDQLGRALQSRLIAAAARGVAVYFVTDRVGSMALPDAYRAALSTAGVSVVTRDHQRGPKHRFQLNYRNHRKTVIIDGITGFTGGLNVGDEYLGRDHHIGAWRDTHVKLCGPMVSQLQLIFIEDWHWATGENLIAALNWDAPHPPEDATGLIVATGPGDDGETGSLMFFSAIAAAQKRVWLASPYFVPDIDILTVLRHAALRGVDVRILVPDRADHWITWLAAFAYFDDIIRAGVRVFRYEPGFMHQKVFVVDDDLAAVGTTNLDNRSFRLNFEAMALMFDAHFARDVDQMLRDDFARSYELTRRIDEQPLKIRYGAPVARLFSPLL